MTPLRRLIFSTLFLFVVVPVFPQEKKVQIIIGSIDSIYSNVLKEGRRILVHMPMTQPDGYSEKQKLPVVYVLDGESLFQSVVTITEQLSGGSGNFMYPKMIIVGITNTDRTRDLTPTHSTDSTIMPAFLLKNSGGGVRFLSFIEKELIPYMEKAYSASSYRILIGHSYGGLMSIYTMLNHNNLFNAYVAIDPSIWWDNQKLLKQSELILKKSNLNNNNLYLAIANTLSKGMTIQTVKKDKNVINLPIRSILKLDDLIKMYKGYKLHYKSKFYNDYDHGSIPLVAVYDALPFILNFYTLHFPFSDFFNPLYKNDNILTTHFKKVSNTMGYEVLPPGELVNALAHQLISTNQLERAYKFFELNIKNYPESFKPYDAMGDFYQLKGDRTKAEEFYNKALSISENPDIRIKIEKLKSN